MYEGTGIEVSEHWGELFKAMDDLVGAGPRIVVSYRKGNNATALEAYPLTWPDLGPPDRDEASGSKRTRKEDHVGARKTCCYLTYRTMSRETGQVWLSQGRATCRRERRWGCSI